jgi:hypothetical protein
MRVESADAVTFTPLLKDLHHIDGGLFTFRGQYFLLFLEPGGPPEPLSGVYLNDEDLGDCQLNFHNKRINVKEGRVLSQVLTIDWPDADPRSRPRIALFPSDPRTPR